MVKNVVLARLASRHQIRMRIRVSVVFLALTLTAVSGANALEPQGGRGRLRSALRTSERLQPPPSVAVPLESAKDIQPEVRKSWDALTSKAGGQWQAYIDRRNGRIDAVEGAGLPWVPGRGNTLTGAAIMPFLEGAKEIDLATMERIARKFLELIGPSLGVQPASLTLDRSSSHPSDHLWFIDFNVRRSGVLVDGARVVFRVNHGNLVQFGTENLPSPEAPTPTPRISVDVARANLARLIGGFTAGDKFLDRGSLHLLPVAPEGGRRADFTVGRGRELVAAWQFTFLRSDEVGTWRARVDAVTGKVLELVDINLYAEVSGGAFPNSPAVTPESTLPMPFADVSTGGYTTSSGAYTYGGGTVTSTLNGQYVRISDDCGAISQGSDAGGLIAFGTSTGTDCTTPGVGGSGNTHAARTQFYQVNRAKEAARGWMTSTWLNSTLPVNVNILQTCNAFWSPGTGSLNFFRSGGGCGNTGEIAGVALHEFGHGLDANDGNGTSSDPGTGEAYGDFTAALATRTSCIGPGFRSTNCTGYGDACTSCTGVRDIDWALHSSGVAHTVANFTQSICPAPSAWAPNYIGPCGREGHCESYVLSEALWDLAARDLPTPGTAAAWATVERLWFQSRSLASGGFSCNTSGTTWTSDGCATGSYWRALRVADDDDGNLANGTPHSCALFAAFNRHGIACATDPGANTCFSGCTPPAAPSLTLTPGQGQVGLSWTSSGGGTVYDVYRNEVACTSGFTRIQKDLAATTYADMDVMNHRTYFYQVVAHPSGDVTCSSPPSSCASTTPGVDLWSQDRSNDTGLEPDPATSGLPMWESEDIWVRNDATPGSHQNPEYGQVNYVHVRVRNRGGVAAGAFNVELYYAHATTGLSWPSQWTLIGTSPVASLASGGTQESVITWSPPGVGHYCLVARIVSLTDPMTYAETDNIDFNARNNNNVVWRNVAIVDLIPLQELTAELLVANPNNRSARFKLLVEEVRPHDLPDAPSLLRMIDLRIGIPRVIGKRQGALGLVVPTSQPRVATTVVAASRVTGASETALARLDDLKRGRVIIPLEAQEVIPMKVMFKAPKMSGGRQMKVTYLLRITQIASDTGQVIGGMTYEVRVHLP